MDAYWLEQIANHAGYFFVHLILNLLIHVINKGSFEVDNCITINPVLIVTGGGAVVAM